MPGGTYFAEYDWTWCNQVGYLNGSVCDLKFFRIAASKKYLQLSFFTAVFRKLKPAHKYLYNAGKLTCLNGSLTHKKSV
jgi:hypothetical protein